MSIATGVWSGLRASSQRNEAQADHCDGTGCDAAGGDLVSSARTAATISTLTFIAGGALVVAGAIVFFTAPRSVKRDVLPALTRGSIRF